MSDMPKDDELDRAMARNFGPPHSSTAQAESIVPSSGFAASVMEHVRAEAARSAALSPIAFPWLRAIPGIAMAVLAIVLAIVMLVLAIFGVARVVSQTLFSAATAGSGAPLPAWAELAAHMHLGWLIVAFGIAFVPLMISRSLVSRGHRF